MNCVVICMLMLVQGAKEGSPGSPPPLIQKYLRSCEDAKTAAIAMKTRDIKGLEAVQDPTTDVQKQLQAAQAELKRLQEQPAPLTTLPLPTENGAMGVFAPVHPRLGQSVDVLEVVDEDDVIVRAWYWITKPLPPMPTAAEDATFVDLWIHGIDTSRLAANSSAELPQVFHVAGNKLFDTTCGKRSLPLLEPIDLSPYRGTKTGNK